MKTIYRFNIIAALALMLCSCSDFLKESSQDEIKPKSANDYKELIAGEVYQTVNEASYHTWLDIMTDDCEEWAKKKTWLSSDTRNHGYGYFTWQQTPEYQITGVLNSDKAWYNYYHQILVANMVLYDIDEMSGTEAEKAAVKAEAYMIRAYAYYMLVNIYGEPYDPATASTAAGVPVNDLVGAENKQFSRESVRTVYDVIVENARNALAEFAKSDGSQSVFRWNEAAADVLLSRVYLYMQDWESAARYASAALDIKADLWDLNQKAGEGDGTDEGYFLSARNPEILFSYGYYYVTYFATGACGAYPASTSLRAMYATGDLRGGSTGAYIRYLGSAFMGGGKRYVPYKSDDASTTGRHGKAIRTAEAYLNRAEANAHIGNLSEALADLEMIRKNRFTPAAYAPLTASASDEVLQAVKDERRRELCFEQQRWFDLRRWDRPSITHRYTPDLTNLSVYETFVLEKDDPAYTLPLPQEVLENDPAITNISRPERKPVGAE